MRALDKEEATDYEKLKAAILNHNGITPEAHRQWFHSITLSILCTTTIACYHGHIKHSPVVMVPLRYLGQVHDVLVAKVENLPYPLLLGRDAPLFAELMWQVRATQVKVVAVEIEEGAARDEEPAAGCAGDAKDDEPDRRLARRWQQNPAFPGLGKAAANLGGKQKQDE
ncbi:UNVERIFIED_CONTAM: hypothetical protein K2H54_014765 [Gekko kuhli]